MRFTLLLLLCASFLVPDILAQGFNIFNNRNHPELKWLVVETKHFKIIYPERIQGIERLAGTIAEETYDALSKNMGVTFTEKVRLYLSDEDEIENGFANPIGRGYSMMWVNLNGFRAGRSGSVKWLRHVMAHELAHIFHYKAVWSELGILQFLVATPIERHWTEGIAQYETEKWNSQRGDRWLRKAIFDSQPNFRDENSIENGALMYAVGNAQLRYFTEKYGDSTLVDMLAWRNKKLGLLEYHDFDEAFDEHVDGGYDAFYEDWLKHMNVYYNTLAASMERTDSVKSASFNLPGNYYMDMTVSPNDSLIAVISYPSLSRPVRSLYIVKNDSTREHRKVAEGSINYDMCWSQDGKSLFYSRLTRGGNSSLYNDIFMLDVETGMETRITNSRKAAFPSPGPASHEVAYIVNEGGTGNLFIKNLSTGVEKRVTAYQKDIQLGWPTWVESKKSWLLYKFDEDLNRQFILLDPDSGRETVLLEEGQGDNRRPILSPNQKEFAYTSLQDEVPNIFIYNFEADSSRRVTNLFTGADLFGWIAETDSVNYERLLIEASETKSRDHAYWIDANRTPKSQSVEIPAAYSSWREKSPPNFVPFHIKEDPAVLQDQYDYRPIRNLTHAVTIAFPYYAGQDHWGIGGSTNWLEPIGKHLISAFGSISFPNIQDNTYGAVNYQNNQLYPSLTFSAYSMPANSRFYGSRYLVEKHIGGEVSASWPLDIFSRSYQSSNVTIRFRHILVDPLDQDDFIDSPSLPAPIEDRQSDLKLEWIIKKQKPWIHNAIHPLDGYGLKTSILGAGEILGSDLQFLEADINSYVTVPTLGAQRLFIQARYQQQWGEPLPQDDIGLTRFDNITLSLPDQVFFRFFDDSERVRGFREYVAGKRVLFGSAEYRIPFIPSLQTEILGLIRLGSTSLTLFTDAAIVGDAIQADGTTTTIDRWGAGAEIKNELQLFGLSFGHSLGVAQPVHNLFKDEFVDFYYRVQAVVPF